MKLISLKNSKGQAFSTFQLLIAAVVALALLGVLMPIITTINPGTDRVVGSTKDLINTLQNQPGTLSLTDEIKVSGKNDAFVSAAAIVEGTGMSEGQINFFANGYSNDFTVLGENNSRLQILVQSRVSYKFGVLCDSKLEKLQKSIEDYSQASPSPFKTEPDLSYEDETARVCIIFPLKV